MTASGPQALISAQHQTDFASHPPCFSDQAIATENGAARQQPPTHRRRQVLAVCVLLLLAVAVVFGQAAGFDFVNYDDQQYVYENDAVAAGLTGQGIVWAFTHFHMCNWHPLTWISHMADCQLYGLWPGGHHLTSVVLHGATVIVLFLLLLQMTGAFWPSALAAALFAVHPLRAESVAWVAERKDVLSGFFFVLTLAAYVRYARRPFSPARYSAVLALFACGLMAKPMLVTLPCVLLLLDWWPLGRLARSSLPLDQQPEHSDKELARGPFPFINLLVEKIPLFALVAAACCVAILAQRETMADLDRFSLSARIANALVVYMTYVVQLFMPVDLAVNYPHPGDGLPVWKMAGSLAALATITSLAVVNRRQYPYLLVGWLWYLGMLVPVIGILQVGSQARADRYTYLPQIGLCVALAWGAADLARSWSVPRRTQAIAAVLGLAALMGCAWRQTSYWQNTETLWRRAVACRPDDWRAHITLGSALLDQNKLDEAIGQFEKIAPSYVEAHYNLGMALDRQGKTSEAMVQYEKALEIQPRSTTALDANANSHNNLGRQLDLQGKTAEAMMHYTQALEIQPNHATARFNLANDLAGQGKLDEAIVHYEKALEIQPSNARGHNSLGAALDRQGKTAQAVIHYQKALDIEPNDAAAHYNLGMALDRQGKLDEAIVHYEKALEIQPRNASVLINLALVLARQGKTSEAIARYERILAFEPRNIVAHYYLGQALGAEHRIDEAIEHYRTALRIEPRFAVAQLNLVDSLAAQGKSDAAIAECQQALGVAEAHNNGELIDNLRDRLRRFGADSGSPAAR
jgi:tetratricopeptide (TPR) repeat protein